MGYKFNPFTGNFDTTDSPNGVFDSVEVNGDVTLDDGGSFTTTLQTITPTQNNTISLPNATGTLALVAGSSGSLIYNNAGAYTGVPGATVGSSGNITLNAASGFTGNLLDLQVNGTSQARFTKEGTLAFGASNTVAPSTAGVGNWYGTLGLFGNSGSLATTISSTTANFSVAIAFNLDTFIQRDAANTLAQRNGTSAQTFRVYNTYTSSTNYELGKLEWSSNVFRIGTEKGSVGGTARNLELQTDGTTRLTINGTSGSVSLSTLLSLSSNGIQAQSTGYGLFWANSTTFNNRADGVLTISNYAENDFGRLQFGGTTSSFPAIKRSGTALQARLADDSGYTTIDAQLRAQGTAPATASSTGTAGDIRYDADYIYVCTATNTWKRAALATW